MSDRINRKNMLMVRMFVVMLIIFMLPAFSSGKAEAAPQYVWEKFSVVQVPTYKSSHIGTSTLDSINSNNSWYANVLVDPKTGVLTGDGVFKYPVGGSNDYSFFEITSPTTYQRVTVTEVWNGGGSTTFQYEAFKYQVALGTGDGKGSSLGYVTSTTSGLYPTNGIYGSYWYVSKGINTAPVLSLTSSGDKTLYNDGGTFTMTGTVQDADNDSVSVSATIGGVLKSTTVTGTTTAKSWTLTWSGSEIPVGVYTNPVVTASDGSEIASASYVGKLTIQAQIYYYWSKFTAVPDTYGNFTGPGISGAVKIVTGKVYYGGYFGGPDPESGSENASGWNSANGAFNWSYDYVVRETYPTLSIHSSYNGVPTDNDTKFYLEGGKVFMVKHSTVTNVYGRTRDDYVIYQLIAADPNIKKQGTLVQANIKAAQNTYPDNGIHSDGYWYVKSGTVPNNLPALAVTQSGSKSINLKSGSDTFTISGTTTDADNETISVTATLGGVAKQVAVSNTATAKAWSLTWRTSEFTTGGSFSNPVITVDDGRGGVATATYTGSLTVDKTALFYWDKYSVKELTTYEVKYTSDGSSSNMSSIYGFSSYSLDSFTGKFTGVGTPSNGTALPNTDVSRYTIASDGNSVRLLSLYPDRTVDYTVLTTIAKTQKTKGTLIQSNILDLDKTYPDNGIHVDGYWYVKKSNNNLFPLLTVVSEDKVVNSSSKEIKIKGTLKDADNDTVTVSATIAGVTKTVSVSETGVVKDWTLTWLANELPEGIHSNFNVTANDGKGGIETVMYRSTIMYDKTAPSLASIKVNPIGWSKEATVEVTPGTDTLSGVKNTEYRVDQGPWVEYSSPVKMNTEGTFKVSARSTDHAGNITDEVSDNVQIDLTNPEISISPDTKTWSSEDVDIRINFSDILSGINVNERKYKVTATEDIPTLWDTANKDDFHLNLSQEGRWFVHAKTQDNAGNKATAKSEVFEMQRNPVLPSDFRASTIGDHFVEIQWDLPSTSFTDGYQYNVENVTTGKKWTVEYPEHMIREDSLQAGTKYSYRIKVKNHVGETPFSSDLQVLTLPSGISSLKILPVERVSSEAIVSFDVVQSAERYHIKIEESQSHKVIFSNTVTDNKNIIVTGLSPGIQYVLQIVAENSSGLGETSSIGFLSLPGEPGEFKAVQILENQIDVEWNGANTASMYELLRNKQSAYVGDKTKYTDKDLESGTSYNYQVSATNSTGFGAISYLDDILTLPSQVKTVTADTYGTDQFTIRWKDVTGADKYYITIDGEIEAEVRNGKGLYVQKGLVPGRQYRVGIYASNKSGSGSINEVMISTLPDQPKDLSVDSITENSAVLHWKKVAGADMYRVTINGKSYDVSDNKISITNLIGGQHYTFEVMGGNVSGFSESATEGFLTLPSEVNNIRVKNHTATTLQLVWDGVISALKYHVTFNNRVIVTDKPGVTIDSLVPGETYTFMLKAVNDTGEGMESNYVWRTIPSETVGEIRIEEVTVSTVTLSWDAIDGADQYRIVVPGQKDKITTDLKVIISGLESAKEYDSLKLFPMNTTGDGKELLVGSFVTLPGGELKVKTEIKEHEITYKFELTSPNEIIVISKDGKEIYRGQDKEFTLGGIESGKEVIVDVWTENSVGDQSAKQIIKDKTLDAPVVSRPGSETENNYNSGDQGKPGLEEDKSKGDISDELDTNTKKIFNDIDGLYNKNQVLALWEQGVVKGEGEFQPKRNITRAEFMSMIVRALDLQPKESNEMRFKDISNDAWYYKELKIAYANKLVKGFSETEFRPNDTLTREQASKMLSNMIQPVDKSGKVFKDQKKISTWAKGAVEVLSSKEIVAGYPDETFRPKISVNRAEGVSFIYKFIQTI
ncbi:fibronectin type III domain-containing protein [Paenibacillus macquariensis]|uniref:S-layer homology domain-containing protein n=1 Tax=Paenibacillus macquariensis TaxID=948756 RepID=A0ABY1KEH0_9BACL|nr:S-layer homology domain-containing protein [Paenibacillus macquariensis]OAB30507.1 hypothetical protein PMSM_22710 [Paenibacillus macquariensis subsp. macquariensis]SIR71108.1 S-layer homology domain-containing protein [Paenibacillus macquariensis]